MSIKVTTNYSKNFKVMGVGINDATYKVRCKGWVCPYYVKWRDMLRRCYYKDKYEGVTVCEDWLLFSNFQKWVDIQPNKDWQNCQLDKDLLGSGKLYSPDNCVFIPLYLNAFITSGKRNSKYLLGVGWHKRDMKFYSQCNNPLVKYENGRNDNQFLGYFETEHQAHVAYMLKKHEYACQLADLQEDPRVAEALRQRYKPD